MASNRWCRPTASGGSNWPWLLGFRWSANISPAGRARRPKDSPRSSMHWAEPATPDFRWHYSTVRLRRCTGTGMLRCPHRWNGTYRKLAPTSNLEVRHGAMALAVIFNDRDVIAELLKLVADPSAATADRAWAIEHLLDARDPQLGRPAGVVGRKPELVGRWPCADWRCSTVQRRPRFCSRLTAA